MIPSSPTDAPRGIRYELKVVKVEGGFQPFIMSVADDGEDSFPSGDPFGNPVMPTCELAEELGVVLIWNLIDHAYRGKQVVNALD